MLSQSSLASYFSTVHGDTPYNPKAPTHVLVAGKGSDLGTLFQQAAAAKAHLYKDLFPDEQVLLVTYNELGLDANNTKLLAWGFENPRFRDRVFDEASLLYELKKLSRIKSIDFFTHNSALYGSQLEGSDYRINPSSQILAPLASRFTADAYAVLHGCNTGFYMAPNFSAMWGIPVMGSLTSTGFQALHSDRNFYFADDAQKPEGPWAWRNFASFTTKIECVNGGCLRMKPDNQPYEGIFGAYKEGGLPFFKMFCAQNSVQDCERAMATIMLQSMQKYTFVGADVTREKYQAAVIDWLCPISAKNNIREQCAQYFLNYDLNSEPQGYNPFQGKQLACQFDKCEFEFSCDKINGEVNNKSCVITNPNRKATTIEEEYVHYMNGYDILVSEGQ